MTVKEESRILCVSLTSDASDGVSRIITDVASVFVPFTFIRLVLGQVRPGLLFLNTQHRSWVLSIVRALSMIHTKIPSKP